MGYRRNRTVPLVFTGEMAEFEATAKVISLDEWFEVAELCATTIYYVPTNKPRLDRIHELMLASLVEWNLEDDDGAPVPVSAEAFAAQDRWFQSALADAWVDQMVQVSDPLDQPSSSGPTELAEIPMAENPDPSALAS